MSGTCEGLHCSLLALGNPKASLGFRTLSNQLPFFHPFPESLPFSILFPNLPERQRDFTSPFSQLLCLPVYAPVLSLCHSWTVIIWGFLGKQVCLNGLRHLGDSGNGGTTLEFLSPFLWFKNYICM